MIDFSYGLSLLFYKIKNKLSGKRNKYDEDAQEAYQTVYPNTFDSEEMNDENVTESEMSPFETKKTKVRRQKCSVVNIFC